MTSENARPGVRPATAGDAAEIVRLARVMWTGMGLEVEDRADPRTGLSWGAAAEQSLADGLAEGRLNAFVAAGPSGEGLVACGIAVIYELLPAPWIPDGRMGYLQWFSTEPQWRRSGIGAEILDRAGAWLKDQGVRRAQLHSSAEAEALYRRSGFSDAAYANLWLRLSEPPPA